MEALGEGKTFLLENHLPLAESYDYSFPQTHTPDYIGIANPGISNAISEYAQIISVLRIDGILHSYVNINVLVYCLKKGLFYCP